MHQALWLLLETLGSLLATACLLRAYMNRVGLGARNPVGQFVVAITDWLVRPLRRVVPSGRTTDWASIVGGFLVSLVLALVFVAIFGGGRFPAPGAVLLLALFWLVKWSLWLLTALVLLQAVLSWVNPYAPIAPTIAALTQPFLAPIRRIVPLVGGVDLSPLVLILLVQVLLTLLQSLLPGMMAFAR
ncbi:YggT family protein [Burkholderiaceae bacterium FT117]|uniref:YggT family protein n=1 Tax=Zeimonas sediminis TaxID=2944268 RepID=UPI002342D569|nr:YggT family protein [Zeimonas sediminis]MCM5570694.1 YggT family protein [Zeimonas sediminis]